MRASAGIMCRDSPSEDVDGHGAEASVAFELHDGLDTLVENGVTSVLRSLRRRRYLDVYIHSISSHFIPFQTI